MFGKVNSYFKKSVIGIDLGTANVVICSNNAGVIVNEPSIVALLNKDGRNVPYAFGKEAKIMFGRSPSNIKVVRPMKDGVIADFKVTTEMIRYFIDISSNLIKSFVGKDIIICVPSGATPVERKAIQEAAELNYIKNVYLIEEPMAAAIGAGLPVLDSTGSIVVDIGGGTTEIGILSLGGIVYGNSLRIAGDKMDEAIISYVKKNLSLLIGDTTAERIKVEIGSAIQPLDGSDGMVMKIRGRDLGDGVPKEISITEKQIVEALSECVNKMVSSIKDALESIPPELSADIVEKGIILSGGGALLRNLDLAITQKIGLNTYVAENPLLSVISGINKVINNMEDYKMVLFRQE
ncbi:MAG: rod shape-determining protein [Rickettsiales bacterium]|jgi:rod shape-determining protein MreB|nr:rod shape-determining protein [Rickettsiales bacterium]